MSGLEMQVKNRYLKQQRIMQFLRDYCYAIYLGVFGAYLFGWIGLLLFGAWGLWNDKKITKRKNDLTIGCIKETFMKSKLLRKKIEKFKTVKVFKCAAPYLYVGKYIIWGVVSIVIGLWIGEFIFSNLLMGVMIQTAFKNPSTGASADVLEMPTVVIEISRIIPFVNKYIAHVKIMEIDTKHISAIMFSYLWIVCLVRSPKLFQYFDKYSSSFKNIKAKKQIIMLLLVVVSFCYAASLVLIGWDWLMPEGKDDVKKTFWIVMFLVPAVWVLFSFVIGMVKNLYEEHFIKNQY